MCITTAQTVVVAAPLDVDADSPDSDSKPRRLTGRFLHLTDMHPDPFYRTGGTESSACHRKKPKKKKKAHGGEFGLPFGCVQRFLNSLYHVFIFPLSSNCQGV